MKPHQVVHADWTWTGERFESDVQIAIDADGRILQVGALDFQPTKRLSRRALIPGFINAHSHAFQRGLRGGGEDFPDGRGSFWSWREAMYRLVAKLDGEAFYRLCRQAFSEMRAAGITAVGEFHYLHHSPDGADFAFDDLILKAAGAAGIRIVLLEAFYKTGGIGQPPDATQRRFRTPSPEEYWRHIDALHETLEESTQSIGAVVHSVRAASLEDIGRLHAESLHRKIPFHIHVEEQRKEVEDAIAAYGKPPMAALHDVLGSMHNVTAVHCTHTAPADMARFLDSGGTACVCPTTEGNLGDGIPGLPAHHPTEGRIVLGTDSNLRICMTEEMRWLEYVQRLASQSRGLYIDGGSTARRLLDIATTDGARSLGLDAGRIAPGACADFAAIDLEAPALHGCDETSLLETLVFSTGNDAVAETCVAGRWDAPSLP